MGMLYRSRHGAGRSHVPAKAVFCIPCVISVLLLAFPVSVMSAGNQMATASPSGQIVQKDKCSFQTDEGIINLWDLGNPSEPRFQYQPSSTPGDTSLYTFDPCYPFTQDDCQEALVCRFDKNRQNAENIGAGQPGGTFVPSPISSDPVLMFSGPIEEFGIPPKITYVTLKCQEDILQRSTLEITSSNDTTVDVFNMVLTSPSCCPRGSGPSFGTVLIILFLCVVVVYLVVGILYNMIARGASGIEVIPHISFWKDFPNLVMDGVTFVLTCGKGGNTTSQAGGQSTPGTEPKSGYESI